MLRVNPFLAVGIVLYAIAGPAQALGFGKVSNATVLGQPLNLSASVRLDPDETLGPECVTAEVQSGENRIARELVRLSIEPGADANERSIRITTSSLIDEPVVAINLSAGCKVKLARRFVVFVDPPEIALAQSQTVDPASLPTQKIESPAAPALALTQQPRATRPAAAAASPAAPVAKVAPRTRSRNRIVLPDGPPKALPTPASAPPTPSQRSTTVAVRPQPKASEPQSRLKLEAPLPGLGRTAAASAPAMVPNAAEQASAAAAAAQSRAEEATAALARERQRLQALEENLSKLLRESQTTQASLATLQARLRESESQRGLPSQTMYGLGGLAGLLALAVAILGWQLIRTRRQAKWWDESVAAAASTRAAADNDSRRVPDSRPAGEVPTARKAVAPAPAAALPAKAVVPRAETTKHKALQSFEDSGGARVGDGPDAAASTLPPMSRTGPRRELSVEELIDLEQQAEFFIVLGQDDAAIDLLMNHVRSTGGISPLPYMKLLEIYRRLGDESAYERIRERFNRRFNAYAPEWGADLQMGRTIEGYPQIITRLQTLWPNPVRVMETLDASLFRRDNEDETFELPAYRDLLFLYSIARDLAEREVGGGESEGGDLLLPFDGGQAPAKSAPEMFAAAGTDDDPLSLDLDVSLPGAIEFTPPPKH